MAKQGYDEKDSKKDTSSTDREQSAAWHQARQDAQKSDNTYDQWLTKGWKRDLSDKDDIQKK